MADPQLIFIKAEEDDKEILKKRIKELETENETLKQAVEQLQQLQGKCCDWCELLMPSCEQERTMISNWLEGVIMALKAQKEETELIIDDDDDVTIQTSAEIIPPSPTPHTSTPPPTSPPSQQQQQQHQHQQQQPSPQPQSSVTLPNFTGSPTISSEQSVNVRVSFDLVLCNGERESNGDFTRKRARLCLACRIETWPTSYANFCCIRCRPSLYIFRSLMLFYIFSIFAGINFKGSPTVKNLHIDYLKLKDIIRSADDRRGDKMKYLLNKLVDAMFTRDELVAASGLGIRMHKDKRHTPLDRKKLTAIKDFLEEFAEKNRIQSMDPRTFRVTVGNKITNARRNQRNEFR